MEDYHSYDEGTVKSRAAKKLLQVTFPGGKKLCYKSATVTFIETLRTIGIEQLQQIKLEVSHFPLISQELFPKLEGYQKPLVRGWYVTTMSDTEQKYRQLLSIKSQLNLDIEIEMGSDLEAEKTKLFQKGHKSKDSLLVKFPDGEYVGGESPKETFIEAIKKIGIDALVRRKIELSGKSLITSTLQYKGQIEVEENRWLYIPGLTKDKVKCLKVIGAYMSIKLEITTI